MFCRSCNLLRIPFSRTYASSVPKISKPADLAAKVKPKRKEIIAREPELAMTSRKLPTSLKKMDKLASLINHKPLSHAMLQMKFSNKRHAPHLEKLLRNARNGAIRKGMDEESLVIDQAWITKGKYVKRLWVKGRGRLAVQRRPRVGIDIRVRDKTTIERRTAEKRDKMVRKMMKTSGLVNKPLYNSSVFTC
ncbi:54S ribosomal protein L22,mitochondrial [Taphrina deformans PYCC 5710]|uniref:54S ribosomal protein L22,mitochondrial n=1 Tax=Taphrina deformans (strain PYCC 5710 / ATCC 11124 / CBS 356.35 / IMI 108563 / JCM 9778 / NBRC 8474) TaxID=1097556 RepID=R4XF05_TAPDE|nr:54S ribosomal protein L22,mitochondrial [Taphrina deformans PYCC 5710]|eukprot:CCG83051.1 54S ribosomal protein L22,mitochondrial [Taphrina deformans PYCC 5710]